MGDGDTGERSVTHEGVTVRKTIEPAEDRSTAVTLEVRRENDRKGAIRVRLREPALDDVPGDRIEFESDRTRTNWTFSKESGVFEGVLESGRNDAVDYRVTDLEGDPSHLLDADPEVTIVAAKTEAALDGLVDRTDSDAVRSFIEGDERTLRAESEQRPEAGDGESSDGKTNVDETGGSETSGGETGDGEPVGFKSGGVARVLLRELRRGNLDDETVRGLREELDAGESRDVRIRHLQGRVSDLAAYGEELETFIDEHGAPSDAIRDLEATVEALRTDVDGMAERLDEEIGALEREVDEIDDRVDDHRDAIETLREETPELRDGQDALREREEALEADLEGTRERIAELEAFRESLSTAFRGPRGNEDATEGDEAI